MGFDSVDELVATPLAAILQRYEFLDEDATALSMDRLPSRLAFTTGAPAQATLRFRLASTGEERTSVVTSYPLAEAGPTGATTPLVANVFRDISERP
jgi:hypothetical protein